MKQIRRNAIALRAIAMIQFESRARGLIPYSQGINKIRLKCEWAMIYAVEIVKFS